MRQKFHINPTTGSPSACRAQSDATCPFRSMSDHYGSEQEAYDAIAREFYADSSRKKAIYKNSRGETASRVEVLDELEKLGASFGSTGGYSKLKEEFENSELKSRGIWRGAFGVDTRKATQWREVNDKINSAMGYLSKGTTNPAVIARIRDVLEETAGKGPGANAHRKIQEILSEHYSKYPSNFVRNPQVGGMASLVLRAFDREDETRWS